VESDNTKQDSSCSSPVTATSVSETEDFLEALEGTVQGSQSETAAILDGSDASREFVVKLDEVEGAILLASGKASVFKRSNTTVKPVSFTARGEVRPITVSDGAREVGASDSSGQIIGALQVTAFDGSTLEVN